MNLFISDNFMDTIGTKVNVLQLIRQVAEDDDVVHSEVLAALSEYWDMSIIDALDNGVDFADILLQDDTAYANGESLKAIFEILFPGDYTQVIDSLVNQLAVSDGTLRLDHNCVPVALTVDFSDAVAIDPVQSAPESHVVTGPDTMSMRSIEPFQEDQISIPEVATLSSDSILGELYFDGKRIPTVWPTNANGVLFDVEALYRAIYGIGINPDHLRQILVTNASLFSQEDYRIIEGQVFLSISTLSRIHPQLGYAVEWDPMVARIVRYYAHAPLDNVSFNLLGNQVG